MEGKKQLECSLRVMVFLLSFYMCDKMIEVWENLENSVTVKKR